MPTKEAAFETVRRLDNRGVTLAELLIVTSVIAILTVALGFSYVGWMGGYKVEREIRQLYAAMLDARTRAVQFNLTYFMDISTDGKFYRISQDDSEGTAAAKPKEGDGIFQAQAAWAAIQASTPVNWGGAADTTDGTITALSHKTELTTKTGSLAGLYAARNSTPLTGVNNFMLGFDRRGIMKNMIGQTNIQNAGTFPASYGLSICLFTDYDGNGTSDYSPDYDCINLTETSIKLGKLKMQNTDPALGGNNPCQNAYNSVAQVENPYGCLSK
ncbi:MAG: prepilin-type N-terminal cleavage/methylation domain-containing protein [Nitrospirae bacterium]|nr:prepilin-type N-terminal cleavage/methylation domain-containing protein [Nitrospirota bacterium]